MSEIAKPDKQSNLLLGVTGSIAAYRTPDLVTSLRRSGFIVKTILSDGAKQFVTKDSIAAMSRAPVYDNQDRLTDIWRPTHIELAGWADVALVAPATAKTIGQLALGIADGLLLETFLALPSDTPKLYAPAMNCHMYTQPSVQRNMTQLNQDGYVDIEPRQGELACGDIGIGKIGSIEDIVSAALEQSYIKLKY
jgi:phosphopantothenoylcysteine decarboxylase